MITHKEQNAQKRDEESNCFHIVPVHCCLHLKTEGGGGGGGEILILQIKFQNQQFPLFKVNSSASGHKNTTVALERAAVWLHKLQSGSVEMCQT